MKIKANYNIIAVSIVGDLIMEFEGVFTCVYCFEENDITVDSSGGKHQEYVEDCQVCCRPNYLVITINEETRSVEVTAEPT